MIINMIGSVVEKDVLVFSANIEMSEVLHKKFFSSWKNNWENPFIFTSKLECHFISYSYFCWKEVGHSKY